MNRSLTKALVFASITCSILSILVAWSSPAIGWEESVYAGTPVSFWIFLMVSIACAIGVMIERASSHNPKSGFSWQLGFFVLIFDRLILHYFPFIRGYVAYRGDHMSNLGQVQDVIISGNIAPDNFYPVTHVFLSSAASASDLPAVYLSNLSTGFMSIMFVVSIYLLGRMILRPRDQILLAAAAASVAFNGYDILLMPAGWSIFLLPIVILVFLRFRGSGGSNAWGFVFVILLVVYPFFHPLSCLFLVACLSIFGIHVASIRTRMSRADVNKRQLPAIPWRHVTLLLVILIPWLLSFQGFRPNLLSLYESIVTGTSSSYAQMIGETLDKTGMGMLGFVVYVIKTMGDDILFLTMAVLVIFQIRRTGGFHAIRNMNLVWLMAVVLFTGCAFGLYLFDIMPGLSSLSAERFLMYAVIFSPILAAYFLGQFVNRTGLKRVLIAAICVCVLLGASVLSVLSLYPSPYVMVPNNQVSHMDEEVYDWLFHNCNSITPISSILSSPDRYGDLIFGTVGWSDRFVSGDMPPDHFGFDGNGTNTTWVDSRTYLVLNKLDKQAYVGVWSTVGRFNNADFEAMLDNSYFVGVYSNGESEVWLVYPT